MNDLLSQLEESSFDAWESVSSVLGHSGERAVRLLEHIRETKQLYWTLIAQALNLDPPPESLEALMRFELEQTARLSPAQLEVPLRYSGRTLSVAALIRLSARHAVWHAGQIALRQP